jgi:UDP-3-O-[3-hydroxymyristoyl] N-acetylglucosamine deacetylase/3-hydroxyacyl-[acyl-carrier-protein] dehydratase
MSEKKRTLKSPITVSGVGLHTGESATLTIHPAEENYGYKFQRIDVEGKPIIEADCDLVVDTSRGTTLGKNGVKVSTVEHVLAALVGMQIDNAHIEIDGPEVPIMDGSSKPFVEAIEKAGFVEQNAIREYFVVDHTLTYEDTEKNVEMLMVPSEEYRLTVMVDYNSDVLGTQHASMYHIGEFQEEISKCRTFVFLHELEALLKHGLAKGGDLNNAIVIVAQEVTQEKLDELARLFNKPSMKVVGKGVLNNLKLQYQNEPARHKLLDIVGDMALVGMPLKAHILSARPGHAGNVAFAKKIKVLIKAKKAMKKAGIVHFDLNREPLYNINDITRMLPHRYPFLMVDKIMEMDSTSIVGVKNISFNEPFFQGHFPDNPVFPGVLQIEAMAQVGGIFALSQVPDPEFYSTYFMKIDGVKFKQKVIPGDTVVFKLNLESPIRRGLVNMRGIAYVNGKEVCEAVMLAQVIKDRQPKELKAEASI